MKVILKKGKNIDEGILDLFKKNPKFSSIEDVKLKQVLNRLSTSEYNQLLRDAFKNFKQISTIENESPYQLLLLLKNKPDIFKGIGRKIRLFNLSCTIYDFWLNSFVKDVLSSIAPEEEDIGQTREIIERLNAARNLETLYHRITGKEPKTALDNFSTGYSIPKENPIEFFKEKPKEYMAEPEFKIPDGFLPKIEQELRQKIEQAILLIKTHHDLLVDITKPLESGSGNTMLPRREKPIPPPPSPAPISPIAQAITPPMAPNPRRDKIVAALKAKKG